MTGRAVLIASIFILAALGLGLVLGERIGAQVGRAQAAADLAPDIAANQANLAALHERITMLAEQQGAIAMDLVASWYGPGFHGRPTASGEIYDQHGITAAHKSLPFGTVLIIENPGTGRSVVATITDRGPFIDGRDLDLSYGAALRLGMVREGVVPLRVRVIQ